jgi:dihydroorotase
MCAKGGSVWHMLWSVLSIRPECSSPTPQKPNLKPPITTTEQALEYKATLEKIDPHVQYLMTLYLSPELTPAEIRKAKRAGVVGT